jgi:hypothetical protein
LRARDPRNSRQRRSARCQVQETATGKFHIALTASSRNLRLDAPYVNDETVMSADGAVLPVAMIGDFGTSVDAT